jgi:hypothetical protein
MEEKRRIQRSRVLKSARMLFNHCASTMDCTVRNMSERGACLLVASPVGIPPTFELTLDDGRSRRPCRVTWQSADKIGVVFE